MVDRGGLFDHVIVSTDDEEIAAVAAACGAEVPFMRPQELATDHAGTTEVMAHATRWASAEGWNLRA
jgi:pseudaminic acid cytidylyltransferase